MAQMSELELISIIPEFHHTLRQLASSVAGKVNCFFFISQVTVLFKHCKLLYRNVSISVCSVDLTP